MPKPYTMPFLFDEVLSISIVNLRKWDYLKMNTSRSGVITWSRNGETTSKLTIKVVMNDYKTVLTLDYSCEGEPYKYDIHLTSLPSNLGKGEVWYFRCPYTSKRCRKLHLVNGRFMHRSAVKSGMYSCQTHSKEWRVMKSVYGAYFDVEKYYDEIYSKHFTKYYKGKPTKKYIKLMTLISKAERIPISGIERLMIS